MTRSRATAKKAGTSFASQCVVPYLQAHVDDRIERRALTGAKDRGDVSGWRYGGQRIVAELKDYGGRFQIGTWLTETETERGNDDAGVGLVIAKRRGKADPGEQVVILTLRDLVSLITGERP